MQYKNKFRTLKEHIRKHHDSCVVLLCTLNECNWSCFSSDLRCFINHQSYKHQVVFKGKSHDFNEAGGFVMGLVSDPVKKDKDGKVLHSEHCKGSSCAKTADSRASSRIRTRVNNGLMPSISVDQLAERRKDNKGREYVQSPFHDEWLEIFKKKVDGVEKSVTKKPESVRKTLLGGRPKREMLKQLPVLESEGAGKITRKNPVKAVANVYNKKSKGDPKGTNKKKEVSALAEVSDRMEVDSDNGVNAVVVKPTVAVTSSGTWSPPVQRKLERVVREQVTKTSVGVVGAKLGMKYDNLEFLSASKSFDAMVFQSGNFLIKTELVAE